MSNLVPSAPATVSVETQTGIDRARAPVKSLFTVGDDGLNSEPSVSSTCSTPDVEIPAEPRPVSECLAIFKTDVSIPCSNITRSQLSFLVHYCYMRLCHVYFTPIS